jgi:hypothetical protein
MRVEWLQSALNELAAIWLQAASALRREITAASNALESRLKTDPYDGSQPYSAGRRILFVPPLGVTFRIETHRQTVTVVHTWFFQLQNGQQKD